MKRIVAKRLEIHEPHFYNHDRFVPPLKVISVGYSRWREGDFFYNKNKDLFSLNLITTGNASYRQRSSGFLNSGDLFMAHKGMEQRLECGSLGFLHKRVLIIDGAVLDSFLRSSGLIDIDYIKLNNPNKIIGIMRKIYKVMVEKNSGYTFDMSVLAYQLLLELVKNVTSEYHFAVKLAIDFMNKNLNKNLTLADVCKDTKMSVRHFSRIFEDNVGISPMKFFNNQRMMWAQNMLENTIMSIKEIADALGFEDPLYFSARFKKYSNESPKSYRNKSLNWQMMHKV